MGLRGGVKSKTFPAFFKINREKREFLRKTTVFDEIELIFFELTQKQITLGT